MQLWKPYNDPPPTEFVMSEILWQRMVLSIPKLTSEERLIIDIDRRLFSGIPVRVLDTDAQCKAYCLSQHGTNNHPVWLTDAD